jgi:hypothetical protein
VLGFGWGVSNGVDAHGDLVVNIWSFCRVAKGKIAKPTPVYVRVSEAWHVIALPYLGGSSEESTRSAGRGETVCINKATPNEEDAPVPRYANKV